MKASALPQDPWNKKLNLAKLPKKVVLDKDFAGIKAGTKMFVGTPQIVDAYLKKIPHGQTRTMIRLRRDLARNNDCEATCPVSTAIFLRIAAEAAIEKINAGAKLDSVTPFWRAIEPDSTIAGKLSLERNWITHQREMEQA